ncbi:ATP-grasp domain-containing protein [Pseudomonas luteola]
MSAFTLIAAIEFQSLEEYQEALSIVAYRFDEKDEDQSYCILRERGLEATVLRNERIPFIAYKTGSGDVLDTNLSIDELEKESCRLLLRARTPLSIKVSGISPLITPQDDKRVEQWPDVIRNKDLYLKRKVSYIPKESFLELMSRKELTFPLFVKGSDKGPANGASLRHVFTCQDEVDSVIIPAGKMLNHGNRMSLIEADPFVLRFQAPDWFCPYRDATIPGRLLYTGINHDFITSEVMEILQDNEGDNGKREYRCFVFNGKLCSASRYTDYTHYAVPAEVQAFAKQFAMDQQGVLPISYVVDIAETTQGLQVVELNPTAFSGRYLDNQPLALFKAVHSLFNSGKSLRMVEPMALPARRESVQLDSNILAAFLNRNNIQAHE